MPDCEICQKTFTRLKHLKRHQLIHRDSRPFQCGVCSKPFSRKDGLQRHELIHQEPTTLVQTKGRACAACVSAKTRCTGTLPCQRCTDKHVECMYPPTQRPSGLATDSPMPLASPATEEHTAATQDLSALSNEPSDAISQQIASLDHIVAFDQPAANGAPQVLAQTLVGQNSTERFQDPNHAPYAPDLLRSEIMNFNHDVQGLPSNPTLPAHYGLVYDNFSWEPSNSSTMNWLQMEEMASDFIPMRDFFPTALTADAFSSPSSWHHSIPSPALPDPNRPAGAQDPSNHSPQDSFDITAASNAASNDTCIEEDGERGPYYVDNEKARRTRLKRRRLMTFTSSGNSSDLSFSSYRDFPEDTSGITDYYIDERQHSRLVTHFKTLCVNASFFRPFTTADFPPREIFHRLIQGYFESFQQTLPFLHRPTFKGHERHYALLLAMAALGARFLEHEAAFSLAAPLSELLRRIMMYVGEDRDRISLSEYELTQVRLLYSVSARYARDGKLQRDAFVAVRECTATFDQTFGHIAKVRAVPGNQAEWLSWLHQEEHVRTMFCIWLVDCMMASHTGSQPVLRLSTISDTQLPCTESIWPAESWESWNSAKQNSAPEPPMVEKALQDLYIEKQLPPNLGEFARVIIVHCLYQRTWDVREYFQQRLSHFEPSAHRQSSADVPSPLPVWHPKMESFNKWRNAALDCLDILHWNANALIGLAQGMEHPTVLHLHFSRVVLLCPVRQVLRLARFLAESGEKRSSSTLSLQEAESDLRILQQWVAQDQYKARLATVHAGSIFWHVRRYSTGAFYEPECVALGTLVLWAHSKFYVRSNSISRDGVDHASPAHLKADCDIILLDRPTDDELVQRYVREGNQMHANMKGVGDLFGPQGAHRVLVQGRMLLSTLGAWQEARTHWVDFLSKLERANAGADNLAGQ